MVLPLVLLGLGWHGLVACGDALSDPEAFQKAQGLLSEYCFDCHDDLSQKGDLNVEEILRAQPLVRRLDAWNNVIARIENNDMPPDDKDQPSEVDRAWLLAWLDREVRQFDYDQVKHPGYEPIRRLTHLEWVRTAEDLLHADFDLLSLFPSDLSGATGFDNTANTLFIQPMLMERYVAVIDRMVDQAFEPTEQGAVPWSKWAEIAGLPPEAPQEEALQVRRFLSGFLPRAFRKPLKEAQLDYYLHQFRHGRATGKSFDDAMKAVVASVMLGPDFLFKMEHRQETDLAYRINDWELASRLSYFLWASMPDDSLFELARQGSLHEPAVLQGQIERMLNDPKANTLGDVFAAQWLGFDDLGSRIRMDPIDNPWCTDSLMTSMKSETSMFFMSLLRENQPIQRLIDADYTFLNQEVAQLYGMDHIQGDTLRRVSLQGTQRGGLLGQGSILAVTAFPYRTSPVVRGKWVLATLLGTPPPNPPPNVSELDEEIEENRKLTPREKLEMHRANPKCTSCHEQLDPLGLSLEHFDWFGRWRDRLHRKKIDATGSLPDGTSFDGLRGLQQVLLNQRREDLIRQTTRKMLAYGLGRSLEYYDEKTVRDITRDMAGNGYRFQDLLKGIVTSYPFQFKMNPDPKATPPSENAVSSEG